jgi:hypothetical protein
MQAEGSSDSVYVDPQVREEPWIAARVAQSRQFAARLGERRTRWRAPHADWIRAAHSWMLPHQGAAPRKALFSPVRRHDSDAWQEAKRFWWRRFAPWRFLVTDKVRRTTSTPLPERDAAGSMQDLAVEAAPAASALQPIYGGVPQPSPAAAENTRRRLASVSSAQDTRGTATMEGSRAASTIFDSTTPAALRESEVVRSESGQLDDRQQSAFADSYLDPSQQLTPSAAIAPLAQVIVGRHSPNKLVTGRTGMPTGTAVPGKAGVFHLRLYSRHRATTEPSGMRPWLVERVGQSSRWLGALSVGPDLWRSPRSIPRTVERAPLASLVESLPQAPRPTRVDPNVTPHLTREHGDVTPGVTADGADLSRRIDMTPHVTREHGGVTPGVTADGGELTGRPYTQGRRRGVVGPSGRSAGRAWAWLAVPSRLQKWWSSLAAADVTAETPPAAASQPAIPTPQHSSAPGYNVDRPAPHSIPHHDDSEVDRTAPDSIPHHEESEVDRTAPDSIPHHDDSEVDSPAPHIAPQHTDSAVVSTRSPAAAPAAAGRPALEFLHVRWPWSPRAQRSMPPVADASPRPDAATPAPALSTTDTQVAPTLPFVPRGVLAASTPTQRDVLRVETSVPHGDPLVSPADAHPESQVPGPPRHVESLSPAIDAPGSAAPSLSTHADVFGSDAGARHAARTTDMGVPGDTFARDTFAETTAAALATSSSGPLSDSLRDGPSDPPRGRLAAALRELRVPWLRRFARTDASQPPVEQIDPPRHGRAGSPADRASAHEAVRSVAVGRAAHEQKASPGTREGASIASTPGSAGRLRGATGRAPDIAESGPSAAGHEPAVHAELSLAFAPPPEDSAAHGGATVRSDEPGSGRRSDGADDDTGPATERTSDRGSSRPAAAQDDVGHGIAPLEERAAGAQSAAPDPHAPSYDRDPGSEQASTPGPAIARDSAFTAHRRHRLSVVPRATAATPVPPTGARTTPLTPWTPTRGRSLAEQLAQVRSRRMTTARVGRDSEPRQTGTTSSEAATELAIYGRGSHVAAHQPFGADPDSTSQEVDTQTSPVHALPEHPWDASDSDLAAVVDHLPAPMAAAVLAAGVLPTVAAAGTRSPVPGAGMRPPVRVMSNHRQAPSPFSSSASTARVHHAPADAWGTNGQASRAAAPATAPVQITSAAAAAGAAGLHLAELDRSSGAGSQGGSPEHGSRDSATQPDLDSLVEQVFDILRWRLVAERERLMS